jgi:RNA polymerase sigma-54 factor
MKQTLQLKLSQHLTLTPQLQQSIRLLQLSTLELNQELEKFLMDNPLLERDEPSQEPTQVAALREGESPPEAEPAGEQEPAPAQENAADAASAEIDWLSAGTSGSASRDDGDEPDLPSLAAEATSLRTHLVDQAVLLKLEQRDRILVAMLIDALDDDGYLTQDLDELMEALPAELEIEMDELQIALRHLQQLDPTGVGARTPAECLELQLLALRDGTPARGLALQIVRSHLGLLAARDFARLKKALGCNDDELRQAQRLIQSLNPRPGAAFTPIEARYVVADVIVKKVKNVWLASLNQDAVPRLRVNRMYAEILQNNRNSSSSQLSQQLQEARWLIKNVQQRFETILRVSQAIVDRQRHFFEHGEVAMRPLVLREIADVLGLHESTVSRVTTQKFMLTPRGIFELKYFFGSHVSTEAGGACSATAIRALIKQLVAAEDGKRPLSDSKISEILGQQGIVVARRTIAKYRESLHIPPVNLRKSL